MDFTSCDHTMPCQSFNPFNPEFTNKLSYDCVAFNIPMFCPVDSKINDIKTTATSGFASCTFIVKYSSCYHQLQLIVIQLDSFPWQITNHANPGVVQVSCNISVFYEVVPVTFDNKFEAEKFIPDAIEYCFTIWGQNSTQVEQWVTLQ